MSLKQLWRLQQLELARAKMISQMDKDVMKQLVSEKQALLARREELKREKLAWQKLMRDKQQQEAELQRLERRKMELTRELYGGQVTSLKDLRCLEEQVHQLERKIDLLAESYLKLEEKAQEMEKNIKIKSGQLAAAGKALKEKARRAKENLDRQKEELASLERSIQEAESLVAPALLAHYRRFQERMGPMVLAPAEDGVCGGCGIMLPALLRQKVKQHALVRCESCGRILVMADDLT